MRPQRLGDEVRAAVDAATTPAARLALALALATVHASPAAPARSTTSPARRSAPGSITAAGGGPARQTRT
ncbi:hypothetical protein OG625_20725 [Streptomyces sp. NBC_01351]|uniref:hypothetical protein n=1 Tax=Streptomyces sp. NBC_01351 TaxID=2903833 RepID=UPI002E2ECE7C|nr:hypothetical protein [Streptomyces sp. NBC_01351]